MRTFFRTSLFISAIGMSSFANAGFVDTEAGSLHEETGLVWMDLSPTANMSINEVSAQLAEGGGFEGWRLPTWDEVAYLMDYLYPTYDPTTETFGRLTFTSNYTGGDSRPYDEINAPFVNVFGWTDIHSENQNKSQVSNSHALYINDSGAAGFAGTSFRKTLENDGSYTYTALLIENSQSSVVNNDFAISSVGVFLVEDNTKIVSDVPAPLVGALSLCLLGFMRRRSK